MLIYVKTIQNSTNFQNSLSFMWKQSKIPPIFKIQMVNIIVTMMQNIMKEFIVEDWYAFKEIIWMSVEDFKTVSKWYLRKRGTTWNDQKRARNNLKQPTTSKTQPETTYNKQETTWNDLQRARDNLKWPTASKKQP